MTIKVDHALGLRFCKEVDDYRDPLYWLIGDGKYPIAPSGNSLYYEAHAAWIFGDYTGGEPYPTDVETAIALLKVKTGLLNKKPYAKDDQTHDDYTGACSVIKSFAQEVVDRGDSHGWFYDNNRPNASFRKALCWVVRGWKSYKYLKFWHDRFPGQKAHYQLCAEKSVGFFGMIGWMLSIIWTVRSPEDSSGWLLDYLKIRIAEKQRPKNLAVRIARAWYIRKLNKYYWGNIRNVYATYFGMEHPFTRYSSWPSKPVL